MGRQMRLWWATIIWCMSMLIGQSVQAQYFYQDLYSTWQANAKQNMYRQLNVKKIQVFSYDPYHERDNSFSVEKIFARDYRVVNSITQSSVNGDSWLKNTYDSQYRIVESWDSSNFAINLTNYRYDSAGRLIEINILSRTPAQSIGEAMLTEKHLFAYDQQGRPLRMIRIKNQTDTSMAIFQIDTAGRVVQEVDSIDGRTFVFHFSYAGKGLLTGIFRYDARLQKTIPIQTWEYDDQQQVRRMTTNAGGNGGMNVWLYDYDPHHLVQRERCLADGKTFIGSVEYTYEFY